MFMVISAILFLSMASHTVAMRMGHLAQLFRTAGRLPHGCVLVSLALISEKASILVRQSHPDVFSPSIVP